MVIFGRTPLRKGDRKSDRKLSTIEELLGENTYLKVCKKADDVTHSWKSFSEIWGDNVPAEFNGLVEVFEIHIYPKGYKRKLKKWLTERISN